MNNKYFYLFAIFVVATFLLISACNKGTANQDSCSGIACAQALPVILLDFVDKQGRDLLNPATPNHLDSAKIIQLNNNDVQILRAGLGAPNANRHKMLLPWKGGETVTMYLKLSDTDQDTITYAQAISKGCCTSYQLTAFSYNGKAYTDSVARHYFTVVK